MSDIGPNVDYTLFSSTSENVILSYSGKQFAELKIQRTNTDTSQTYRIDPQDLLRAVDTLVVAKKHQDQKNGPVGTIPNGPQGR